MNRFKRAFIAAICATMVIPSVGSLAPAAEVYAAESTAAAGAKTASDGTTGGTGTSGDTSTKETASTAAATGISELRDYYTNLEFTPAEKTAADAVMAEAAKKLGYSYTPAAAPESPDDAAKVGNTECKAEPLLGTVDGVNQYIIKMKGKLDDCKTKEDQGSSDVNSNIIIGGKEYDTTIANAGQECTIAVPLVNVGSSDVTDVSITPVLSDDVKIWPFEITKTDYSDTCDELRGTASGESTGDRKHTFRWTLTTRAKAVTGYTKLTFNVNYIEADGSKNAVTLDYYVQVNGVADTTANEDGKISTPRIIVTGFDTDPAEVYAGDTFKLTLHMKNTSKATSVSNMLFDIQGTQEGTDANTTYSAFLPTEGSSTVFVDKMSAGGTKDITIEMKSKADLAQKPYVLTVNMEYEDAALNPFKSTATVSIPIKQEARVDLSEVTVTPDALEVGNEANVMFSIYNTGKTKLYNVSIKFSADSISGGDAFLGNIDPGATGNVDTYITGQAATADDGVVKIQISYEDEESNVKTIDKEMTLYVNEPFYDDTMGMDDMMMEEETSNGKGWIWILVAVLVIILVIIVIIVLKKKKKAARIKAEELNAIDELQMIEDGGMDEEDAEVVEAASPSEEDLMKTQQFTGPIEVADPEEDIRVDIDQDGE